MNVSVTFDPKLAEAQIKTAKAKKAEELKIALDRIFKDKISTPEDVASTYQKMVDYKYCSGKDYKITFEENTIV